MSHEHVPPFYTFITIKCTIVVWLGVNSFISLMQNCSIEIEAVAMVSFFVDVRSLVVEKSCLCV